LSKDDSGHGAKPTLRCIECGKFIEKDQKFYNFGVGHVVHRSCLDKEKENNE